MPPTHPTRETPNDNPRAADHANGGALLLGVALARPQQTSLPPPTWVRSSSRSRREPGQRGLTSQSESASLPLARSAT